MEKRFIGMKAFVVASLVIAGVGAFTVKGRLNTGNEQADVERMDVAEEKTGIQKEILAGLEQREEIPLTMAVIHEVQDQGVIAAAAQGVQGADTGSEKETYEKDQTARKAYQQALLNDERLISPETFGKTEFALTDVNGDGISEMYVFVPGTCNADTRSYLLYYTDQLNFSEIFAWNFGVIQEKGKFISTYAHMGVHVEIYSFDGKQVTEEESLWYYEPDSPEYEQDKVNNDRLAEYVRELSNQAKWLESHEVNRENLQADLGGMSTGRNLEADIAQIRQTYAYTNEHIGAYEKTSVNKNEYAWDNMCENQYFYSGDIQIKQLITDRETGLNIEVYDKNPALDSTAVPAADTLPEKMAVFMFATDAQGREYRIYLKEGYVIRYIGPDHQEIDYPEGILFAEFCSGEQERLSGGDMLFAIANDAAPGWYIAMEGDN